MTLSDTLGLPLRNLRQSLLRTTLTTLGVSIGIASLAGMVSLGVGLQDQVVGRFLQAGVFDSITVTDPSNLGAPGAFANARGGLRGRGGATSSPQTPAPKLDDEELKRIAAMDNVREVYPNIRVPVQMKLGEFTQLMGAAGVPMSAKNEGTFQTLAHGAFFASESDKACMLSLDVAKQIAENDPGSLIGKSATLSYAASLADANGNGTEIVAGFQVHRVDMECRIAGIVERNPGPFPAGGGFQASGVMIPLGIAKAIDSEIVNNAESLLRGPSQGKSYSSITVKVKQPQYTQDVEDRIRLIGYAVFSINDALKGAKTAFLVLDMILSLIGSIALAVSSLGIVNTMVMSILERTREIGIMKAIGASDNDIRRIFLIEAAVIGLLGGIVGIILGWVVGRGINIGANMYIRSQGGTPGTFFSLPLWLIASAIAFSIAVSLVAGIYPASRAAKLEPIQALRHD